MTCKNKLCALAKYPTTVNLCTAKKPSLLAGSSRELQNFPLAIAIKLNLTWKIRVKKAKINKE